MKVNRSGNRHARNTSAILDSVPNPKRKIKAGYRAILVIGKPDLNLESTRTSTTLDLAIADVHLRQIAGKISFAGRLFAKSAEQNSRRKLAIKVDHQTQALQATDEFPYDLDHLIRAGPYDWPSPCSLQLQQWDFSPVLRDNHNVRTKHLNLNEVLIHLADPIRSPPGLLTRSQVLLSDFHRVTTAWDTFNPRCGMATKS